MQVFWGSGPFWQLGKPPIPSMKCPTASLVCVPSMQSLGIPDCILAWRTTQGSVAKITMENTDNPEAQQQGSLSSEEECRSYVCKTQCLLVWLITAKPEVDLPG